ncbi:unnamed protein product [Dicrocoelium dendriticum]|nr:unnamed protein product [Dicrocoelium dendriticum]
MAAASNVTGILVDVNAFSSLTHRYGGLAFWDYATAAPYVEIDMNPVVNDPDRDYVHKDAVYFSMHKFIGGPQTPGVLIAKRTLFKAGESHPSSCGGGTVFFVRRDYQVYLKDVEEREEGGTPAIVESIRAGLVMQLKVAVSCDAILEREESLVKRIWNRLAGCPNIIVLGGKEAPRLPIISVVVRHPFPALHNNRTSLFADWRGCLFLHHNFVCALLNDLFGVQARGGCACAGPYAMDLLGIDEALAKLYEDALVDCHLGSHKHDQLLNSPQREFIRPGFARISLPFFIPDEEADYILDALKFIATYGWIFLPLYRYNCSTGEWMHYQNEPDENRRRLSDMRYTEGKMTWPSVPLRSDAPAPSDFQACLQLAHEELCKTLKLVKSSATFPVSDDMACSDELVRELRWFLLPVEAAAQIRDELNKLEIPPPGVAPWHPGSLSPCFCPDLEKFMLYGQAASSQRFSNESRPSNSVHDANLYSGASPHYEQTVRPNSTLLGFLEPPKIDTMAPDTLIAVDYHPRLRSQSENLTSTLDRNIVPVGARSKSASSQQLSSLLEAGRQMEHEHNMHLVLAGCGNSQPNDPVDAEAVSENDDNNSAHCSLFLLSKAESDLGARLHMLPFGSTLGANSVVLDHEAGALRSSTFLRTPKRNR